MAPQVVSAPSRGFTSEAWKAAVGSGAYARLGKVRRDAQRDAYEAVRLLDSSPSAEGLTEAKLSPLGYDVRLTADGRLQMLQLVAEDDGANASMVLMARQVLESVAGLHLGFDARQLAAEKAASLIGETPLKQKLQLLAYQATHSTAARRRCLGRVPAR